MGESHLGIDGPPSGSEVIYLEQLPDKAVLCLLPAELDVLGQRLSAIVFLLTPLCHLTLSFTSCVGPLWTIQWGNKGCEVGV